MKKQKQNQNEKKDPKAQKLVDELVKKDIEGLRVRSKVNAGGRGCCM